jgi:predicted nucleotide-binding protein
MARRATQSVPPPPAPKKLITVREMQRGIERLRERITELEAFSPAAMRSTHPPEISAIQVAVKGELEREEGVRENISHSAAILNQAIRFLEDEIVDQEQREPAPSTRAPSLVASGRKVFVVHGHDDGARLAVARFLEQLGLEAIILSEQPDQGRTIIEKFEEYAADVGFAVVLLTPDDLGGVAAAPATGSRARQNVIFELGYFAGKLGRGRACLMRKGVVEIPSDLHGVIYTDIDAADGWKLKLVKELKAAKLDFDANRMWG